MAEVTSAASQGGISTFFFVFCLQSEEGIQSHLSRVRGHRHLRILPYRTSLPTHGNPTNRRTKGTPLEELHACFATGECGPNGCAADVRQVRKWKRVLRRWEGSDTNRHSALRDARKIRSACTFTRWAKAQPLRVGRREGDHRKRSPRLPRLYRVACMGWGA